MTAGSEQGQAWSRRGEGRDMQVGALGELVSAGVGVEDSLVRKRVARRRGHRFGHVGTHGACMKAGCYRCLHGE